MIITAETVGSTGVSTLSIAQILGESERNNRRDHITSAVMFMDGRCVQGMEGHRTDLDRLVRRLSEDRRLTNLRVIVDKPIRDRSFAQPMSLCDNPRGAMGAVGLSDLGEITGDHAERIVDLKLAA